MKFVTILSIIYVIISTIFHASLGEVRFICPRPQTPKSNVSQGPCDPTGLNGDSYVTDVSPGPLTIRWEETVFRSGSPSRISLKSRSLNKTCILLDQIPHNDNQFTSKGSDCNVDGYPVGSCLRSMTAITVMIPDIQCDDCYLQLMSIDTTQLNTVNTTCNLDNEDSICPVYYSCASIKIWPTPKSEGRGLASVDSCLPYPENLDGEWPYMPITTLGIAPDITDQFFTRDIVELQGQTLTYNVQPKDLEVPDVMNGTEGLYDVATGLIARVFPRNSPNLLIFQGSMELSEEFLRTRLLSGNLGIGLRSLSEGLIIFPLEVRSKKYGTGEYVSHTAEYTTRGLLRPDKGQFSGSSYITPFRQSGPCALNTNVFNAAVMRNSVDGTVAGLVGLSSVEYSAFVKGVFSTTPNTSMTLYLTRAINEQLQLINRVMIPNQFISTEDSVFTIDGVADLNDFFVLSTGELPDNVEARINSAGQVERLNGKLMPGFFAPIHDEDDELTGLVTLNLLNRNTLDAKLMLVNFPSVPRLGGLYGPALPGRIGARLFLPTTNTAVRSVGTDAWLVTAQIEITSVRSLRHFWDGLLYIDIMRNSSSPPRSITAQLNHLNREACEDSISVMCFTAELQRVGSSEGGATVPANAFVAFLPQDNGEVPFSMIVRDLQPGETVTEVWVRNEETGIVQTITPTFTASLTQSNAVEGDSSFVLPSNGVLMMSVFTSLSSVSPITGSVPSLKQQSVTRPSLNQSTAETPTTIRSSQQSAISTDDFTLTCGTLQSGPMAVSMASGAVNVDSVYPIGYSGTCSFVKTATTWGLPNARAFDGNLCGAQRSSGSNWEAYELTVIVQMEPLIETGADTQVKLTCNFTGTAADTSGVVVTSSIGVVRKDAGSVYQEVLFGRVDQTYSLNIHNGTDLSRLVTNAVLGDSISLIINMAGTDQDEQSLRIRQCKAVDSRNNEVILLDNYCPVLASVMTAGSGFVTSGTRAVLSGLQAFRLKDSPNDIVTFSCIVEPCISSGQCNGDNCVARASSRRRRDSAQEQKTSLRLATSYRVVDSWESSFVDNGDSASQTGESVKVSQLTLLITVSVISCLLLVTVVICVSVYCQLRRLKQSQKSSS